MNYKTRYIRSDNSTITLDTDNLFHHGNTLLHNLNLKVILLIQSSLIKIHDTCTLLKNPKPKGDIINTIKLDSKLLQDQISNNKRSMVTVST